MVLLPLSGLLAGLTVGIAAGQPGHFFPHTSLYDGILTLLLYVLLGLGLCLWLYRHKND